ncbi:hypothetical protein AgCh_024432 [Apium graveolens]
MNEFNDVDDNVIIDSDTTYGDMASDIEDIDEEYLSNNQSMWDGYLDLGAPDKICSRCDAVMWNHEKNNKSSPNKPPTFSLCCKNGQVVLDKEKQHPEPLASLLTGGVHFKHFKQNIRFYNCMFAMSSTGGKIDHSINRGGTPYCFKVQEDEINKRINVVNGGRDAVNEEIVQFLLHMLDEHNRLVKGCQDTVIDSRVDGLQRIFEINPRFMQLQYLLLFPHGDIGYYREIPLNRPVKHSKRDVEVTESEDPDEKGLTPHLGGRLWQQYVVDAFTAIEQNRLDWIRDYQTTIRSDLYHNIKDAIQKGDRNPSNIGKSIILPASFTGTKIPDPEIDPVGYNAVNNYMIHGPCGPDYTKSPCMVKGNYIKHFPKRKKGSRSFEDLKTVNGHIHETFKEACAALGLLQNDNQWHEVIAKNSYTSLPPQLRAMFVNILAYSPISDPLRLWEANWQYEDLKNYALAEGKIVLYVASCGIAAVLLPGGRTAHSRFHIPLKLDQDSTTGIGHGTDIAELIQQTDLIIWDEASMQHRHAFESVDRSLGDIMSVIDKRRAKKPFGGIIVVFGGDYRQILPVIPKASRAEVVGNTEMENKVIADFSKWQLLVGDGKVENFSPDADTGEMLIKIPDQYVVHTTQNPIESLSKITYPDFLRNMSLHSYLRSRAILTPTNVVVDDINNNILEKIPGTLHTYLSQDSIDDVGDEDNEFKSAFPVKYPNSLNMPCIPKHELNIKVGIVVMLMRNLNQIMGLCNDTRMIVTSGKKNSFECEILCGSHVGSKHLIPRIEMIPTDTSWPFEFKRIQFPLQICYAMTINKSQGQSLDTVGLYLPRAVFSHGHVYIGISRVIRLEDQPAQTVPKDKSQYTAEDISSIAKDAKVRHLLHSAIDNVMSNRVINSKSAKEICDALETRCQGTDLIKNNRRTILTQEFFKLLNDLSLVDKEYDLEDTNLKFLLALPESWDLKATTIRDNYALDKTTLDEIYGMLKTHELEMDQRSKRHGRKSRTVALKAEEESPKVAASKKGKGKALITKSDTESSSSDSDEDSEMESVSEMDPDEEMMKLCALMKGNSDKGKVLCTKKKSWTNTSDSESEVNYALMANADSSSEAVELKTQKDRDDASYVRDEVLKMNESLKTELEKEREIIRTWTNSGRTTQNLLSSGNWKEDLGYGDDKNNNGTVEIEPIVVKQKPKVNHVKFVVVKSDIDKSEVKEKLTSDKSKQDKPTEVNIGLMTKKRLKHKLKEVKNVNKVKPPRKNRNGKEGVNKRNDYKHVPNAPRKKCYNFRNSNHLASFCRKNKNINSLPSKSGVKSQYVRYRPQNPCFHCGSLWHSIYTCKEYHSLYYDYYQIKPSLKKVSIIPSSVSSDAKSDTGNRKNILVLDSGYSGHMTGKKALLSDFVEKAGPGVFYGDGNMGKTLGYGNINLGNVIIEKVALISGLKHNLLSVNQICDRGYHVDFFEEHCEVVSKSIGKFVLKGYRHGNIYEVKLSTSSDVSVICLLSRTSIEESWDWHKKLSHLNFSNINELVKKDLVRGLPKSVFAPDGLCDSCQKAKQRKSSFKSKTESSIFEPYHLLHVDLFGLVNVTSIVKKKYAMVIVDEFIRYTWVYFLHTKSETSSILIDHVKQLDKLVKDSVKIIRSDNDTEFKNLIMEEFCKDHGIK